MRHFDAKNDLQHFVGNRAISSVYETMRSCDLGGKAIKTLAPLQAAFSKSPKVTLDWKR